jgi:hypothetical protein
MRALLLFVLLTAVPAVRAAPAPYAKPERRTDVGRMQGEWVVVSEKRCMLHGSTPPAQGRGAPLTQEPGKMQVLSSSEWSGTHCFALSPCAGRASAHSGS